MLKINVYRMLIPRMFGRNSAKSVSAPSVPESIKQMLDRNLPLSIRPGEETIFQMRFLEDSAARILEKFKNIK